MTESVSPQGKTIQSVEQPTKIEREQSILSSCSNSVMNCVTMPFKLIGNLFSFLLHYLCCWGSNKQITDQTNKPSVNDSKSESNDEKPEPPKNIDSTASKKEKTAPEQSPSIDSKEGNTPSINLRIERVPTPSRRNPPTPDKNRLQPGKTPRDSNISNSKASHPYPPPVPEEETGTSSKKNEKPEAAPQSTDSSNNTSEASATDKRKVEDPAKDPSDNTQRPSTTVDVEQGDIPPPAPDLSENPNLQVRDENPSSSRQAEEGIEQKDKEPIAQQERELPQPPASKPAHTRVNVSPFGE